MFRSGFKVEKLKPYLKMSIQRIAMLKNKKTNSIRQQKKLVAELLAQGKDEKARIKTESIVREDFTIEAYEILELLCELLLERVRLLAAEKECPYDMREAVCTLIYASNRTEVKELVQVSQQLTKKYGKEFAEVARTNQENSVNERVVHKLSAQPPNAFLVLNYMKEIAKAHSVDWEPDETLNEQGNRFDVPMMAPTGATVTSGDGSGVAEPYKYTDGRITPGQQPATKRLSNSMKSIGQSIKRNSLTKRLSGGKSNDDGRNDGGFGGGGDIDTIPTASPADQIPSAPTQSDIDAQFSQTLKPDATVSTDSGAVPDFEELSKRFDALKKR